MSEVSRERLARAFGEDVDAMILPLRFTEQFCG